MKEILTALMIWLGANSNFDVNMDPPRVIFLPQDQMEQLYYGDREKYGELYAFYDTDRDVIILRDTWDRRKPWDMSILLHETIHYIQDQSNTVFACNAQMEKETWPLQQKYLQEVHKFIWDYDALWHFSISTCEN
jgi:hypothetical protein